MKHSVVAEQMQHRLRENTGAQSLIATSMAWMAPLFDHEQGLLRYPQNPNQHMVRESLWYAFGLVLRVRFLGGDESALIEFEEILRSVLANQYDAPGTPWHGTFKRAPQEPDPPEQAVVWKDYDPNWRQFIGTVLLLLRKLEGDSLSADLQSAIDLALIKCIEGEPAGRVPATYTNIALMKAWLEVECGDLIDDQSHIEALDYACEIHSRFNEHAAFQEYNSPTYYGINFFALGLWQNFSKELSSMGRQINVLLWEDVARFYHAGMKNLCGPWSRAYGMDMQNYVAALGLWIWAATDRETAPFPASTDSLQHAHDFCLGPIAAFSATLLSDSVKARFAEFKGPHRIHQQISEQPGRQADAYLSSKLMIGLESSPRSFHGTDQYHAFTLHWQCHLGDVHWCRLRFNGSVEGELIENSVNLRLKADEGVSSASLEFSDAIHLAGHTLNCSGLTLAFNTLCRLNADTDVLAIEFPGLAEMQALSLTYHHKSEIR